MRMSTTSNSTAAASGLRNEKESRRRSLMDSQIVRWQTPEDREFESKRAQLAALEAKLAEWELDLATLRAELLAFERRYLRVVGIRYASLDEIEAQIAEAEARLRPGHDRVKKQVEKARARARESAEAASFTQAQEQRNEFKPSDRLKKLYREVAKCVHPDLATDEAERDRREKLMAEANRAYEEGDEARLEAILREWQTSPESVKGEGPGAELVRVIRKIAQVENRLRNLEQEIARLRESELYELKSEVEEAERRGWDPLSEMASRLDDEIVAARARLTELATRRTSI